MPHNDIEKRRQVVRNWRKRLGKTECDVCAKPITASNLARHRRVKHSAGGVR